MIHLGRDRTCEACDLFTSCRNVCVPTRLLREGPDPADTALLVLGEAPGEQEDQRDMSFVGPSGRKLTGWVEASHWGDFADVYAGNIVRCHPEEDRTPTAGERAACRAYLLDDLERLSARYGRVVILCVSSLATGALAPRSGGRVMTTTAWLRRQGEPIDVGGRRVSLWATWHPAACIRDPRREDDVRRHAIMLTEHLALGAVRREDVPYHEIAPMPTGPVGLLGYDTETYGCLRGAHGGACYACWAGYGEARADCPRCRGTGYSQNVFHPERMAAVDGVRRPIVCAGIAWRDDGGTPHTGYFRWDRPGHVARFFRWVNAAEALAGQNHQFDLKMLLRHPLCRLRPWESRLDELLIETFLADDVMPERSLDAVSKDFRLAWYDVKPSVKFADGPDDPDLAERVCRDAYNTLRGVEVARARQESRYGDHPVARSKLTPWRHRWHSLAVWTAISLETTGVTYDLERLESLLDDLGGRLTRIEAEAGATGLVVAGGGSQESIQRLVDDAAAACPDVYGALERTEKTDRVSTSRNNRNILIGALSLDDPTTASLAHRLQLLGEHRSVEKLIGSYVRRLLHGRREGPFWEHTAVPTRVPPRWCTEMGDSAWHVAPRRKAGVTSCGIRFDRGTLIGEKRVPTCPTCVEIVRPAKSATKKVRVPGSEHYRHDPSGALLVFRVAGSPRRVGIAYPHYFLVSKEADESGRAGGTAGTTRWSAKDPAVQTEPPLVSACRCSRFADGVLAESDYAQIEWRMAMYLANDERGLREVTEGIDAHADAAAFMYGERFTRTARWVEGDEARRALTRWPDAAVRARAASWYAGEPDEGFPTYVRRELRSTIKSGANFPWLYGATERTIQASLRLQTGLEIPMVRVEAFLADKERRYPALTAYRERLVHRAGVDGAVHLPICGASRSFGRFASLEEIARTFREKVLDFPPQCHAFNVLLSAITQVARTFHEGGMGSLVVGQTHDAGYFDCPGGEWADAEGIIRTAFEGNDYLRRLEDTYGRAFPAAYELVVKEDNRGEPVGGVAHAQAAYA